MKVSYHSTRSAGALSASQCILKGLADDGGLYVSDQLSEIGFDLAELLDLSYRELAEVILPKYLTDFSPEQIDYCVSHAYNTDNFETEQIFPLHDLGSFGFLELYHGSTIAFKDAALSILPHLLKCAKENCGESRKIVILTATSGDTGKAALEGFKNAPGIDVIVFYPYGGVSRLQQLQMLTQEGENVFSRAVIGNFDDCQSAVKQLFADEKFAATINDNLNCVFSSANSINIGRLVPQIVYYFYSYLQSVKSGRVTLGEAVNFVVPTGNFGNILAGYYASLAGLPVNKFICASNDNNVLTDFFQSGVYDKNRPFKKTISPSMDILISSNLERLIYEVKDRDTADTAASMQSLAEAGSYEVDMNAPALAKFVGGFASEEEILGAIKSCWEQYSYLLDTHTAAGYKVYRDYAAQSGDSTYTILLSTASPFKFAKSVYSAIGGSELSSDDDVSYMYALRDLSGLKLPSAVDGIENRAAKPEMVIRPESMKESILKILTR